MSPTCFDLLDGHVVAGHADDVALRAGTEAWTYARLLEETAAFGGVLLHCGVTAGDHVGIALDDSPELVVAVLACSRIGARHRYDATGTVVVTDRPTDTEAAVVLVKQRPGAALTLVEGREHDWDVVMRAGRTSPAGCEIGATVTPYDARTERLLGPLLEGHAIELPVV